MALTPPVVPSGDRSEVVERPTAGSSSRHQGIARRRLYVIMLPMRDPSKRLRAQLVRLLDWEEAHVSFDKAVDAVPEDRRGSRAAGFEHSPWQLLEHLRLAQKDLLDFCVNPHYAHALQWPDDYWPPSPEPPDAAAWTRSVADFEADREKLKKVVSDARVDLFGLVPTGKGQQTYLRAALLVADHNAYHVGQLVAVRRALGLWPRSH
jgi:DinB superfamily